MAALLHQITIEEYLQEQMSRDEESVAYDPCDRCNRGWCYGCSYREG